MENWEIEYEISSNQVSCKEQIILYGLNIELYPDKEIQYESIDDNKLVLDMGDKSKALSYMQKVSYKWLKFIRDDIEAMMFMEYMQNILKYQYEIKAIIKFKPEIEESRILQSEASYVLIYFFSEPICAQIEDFSISKIHIKDEKTKNKLSLLGVDTEKEKKGCAYNLRKEGKIGSKLLKPTSLEDINGSCSFTLSLSDHSFSKDDIEGFTAEELAIYGGKEAVDRYVNEVEKEMRKIKRKRFNCKENLVEDFIFLAISHILESFNKMKIVLLKFGEVEIYYHKSVEQIFNCNMKNKGFKELNFDKFQKLDAAFIQRIETNTPDMFVFESEEGSKTIIAKSELISCLSEVSKSFVPPKLNDVVAEKSVADDEESATNYYIEFLNNMQIRESNYEELGRQFRLFKAQEHMIFKIEIGSFIRITNRVRNGVLYFVFDELIEIFQLQSVVEAEVNLKLILDIINDYKFQCIPQPRTVEFDGGLKIKLVPTQLNNLLMDRKEDFYRNLVKNISDDREPHFRTIVCTPMILKEFMMFSSIDFPINFVVNVSRPCFEMDKYFNYQTKYEREKIGKGNHDHYHYLKAEVSNTRFSPNNLKKDEEMFDEIMSNNIHDYEVGDYILNEVDEFNISYMIGENIEEMYFTLSNMPQYEYVYFTFHETLVKIKRDRVGNYAKFERADMKDIREYEKELKPVINRAFITGQKFISFNIPYVEIKLVNLSEVLIRKAGNYNLVMYYLTKLKESQRYKIQVKKELGIDYIRDSFAEYYAIRFENKELKNKIKELSFGNNTVIKKKEGKFISMESKYYICMKALNSFKEFYELRMRR